MLAGLVLAGVHAYLGVRLVERGVIFAALAMAQLAALGTTIAYVAGFALHSAAAYFCSLGFTIVGAAIFAVVRGHREAIIGIVYAVSTAAAIVAMSNTAGGSEHLREILVGNILTVSKHAVAETAALYAVVGLFHYIVRKRTLPDFLFYLSFGVVVTSSVAIAGVLLVFSYLIAPPLAAMLFAKSAGTRLAIGWTMGALVSAIGIYVSFRADLPTGATIVCTFGAALLLLAIVRVLVRPKATT